MPRNPNCRKCGLWEGATNVCVWGDGPTDATIVAIGEAPGEAEARTGRPFMGKSGQLLRAELPRAGLRNVYITNVVKCRPPQNRAPTPDELKACRPYLDEELASIKPEFVLALGATAAKAVLKKPKITEAHGQLIPMASGATGMPAFHPAYCLRDPSKLAPFKNDLKRLRRAIDGETVESEIDWHVINKKTIDRFFRELEAADDFSFDLETSGLFPYDGKGFVRCVGFGLRSGGWVIPMEMPDSPYNGGRWEAQRRFMDAVFQRCEGKRAYAHNGKFDNHWLEEYYGSSFTLTDDTMLMHHILDENQPHDLKYLSRAELDVAEYDISTKEKRGELQSAGKGGSPVGWGQLERFYEYNAKDCVYTYRLRHKFAKQLKADPITQNLYKHIVMPGARALQQIERNGLFINKEKFAATEVRVRSELVEVEATLNKMAKRPINWNSPQQVAELFYGELKMKCRVFTDKGKPSTGEAALYSLKGKHEIVDRLIKYRELEKFRGTYIDGWKELMVDDFVYFSYKVHGTVTGRYSSRLHQTPRDGAIRNVIEAPQGWEFVQADFSQAELRIAAELSGDSEMLACFNGGPDIHWRTLIYMIRTGASGDYVGYAYETGKELFQRNTKGRFGTLSLVDCLDLMEEAGHEICISIWKGWKEARKRAKAINFGFVYGMYEKKFIESAKLNYGWSPTMTEATDSRRGYFRLYRGLGPWHDRTKSLARIDGQVRSLSGRLRRLPGIASGDWTLKSEAERQAINSPVQGFIGDFKAMAMIEIHETIPHNDLIVCGEVHDSLLMRVRKGPALSKSLQKVHRIMKHPELMNTLGIELSVPIEADIEIGPWGAGKAWKN